ncbi:MAG: hypothetical protein KGL39_33705 [Patescibacteria group bacterium]|nr:hypothetical protein [Patescibacteria group bacterium]
MKSYEVWFIEIDEIFTDNSDLDICQNYLKRTIKQIQLDAREDLLHDLKEIRDELGCDGSDLPQVIAAIKNLRVDGVKEGMRRAADVCTKHGDQWRNGAGEGAGGGWTVLASDECSQAILTAAEQLTEKDL